MSKSSIIRTIIGLRGSGKTSLAMRFVKYRSKPALIVDLFDQFKGVRYFSGEAALQHITQNRYLKIAEPVIVQTFDPVEFNLVCRIAQEHRDVLLVVDEVDFFDNPRSQDQAFKELIHLGRHYGVDMITTCRRPANISRDLTSQTKEFYIFRITEPRDLAWLKELHHEIPDLVRNLKEFHYVRYMVDKNDIRVMPPLRGVK